MSSNLYPASLSRNLVRTGAFGYRENVALGLLAIAETLSGDEGQRLDAVGSFLAFPDFSRRGDVSSGLSEMTSGDMRARSLGRPRLSPSAASLDKHSLIGPLPL